MLAEKTVLFPRDREGLNPAETTIADMFKEAGYATACVGKWHLGHHPALYPPAKDSIPTLEFLIPMT